jgi:hypothetical protein
MRRVFIGRRVIKQLNHQPWTANRAGLTCQRSSAWSRRRTPRLPVRCPPRSRRSPSCTWPARPRCFRTWPGRRRQRPITQEKYKKQFMNYGHEDKRIIKRLMAIVTWYLNIDLNSISQGIPAYHLKSSCWSTATLWSYNLSTVKPQFTYSSIYALLIYVLFFLTYYSIYVLEFDLHTLF